MSAAAVAGLIGGWTRGDLVALAALGLSIAAFVLSLVAFRQRIRYAPQPKLIIEWGKVYDFYGIPLQRAVLVNHGDAAARDLRIEIEHTATNGEPWQTMDALEPTGRVNFSAPLIDGVRVGWNANGQAYIRDGDGPRRRVEPVVTLRWRQAPFANRPKVARERVPAGRGDSAQTESEAEFG